MRSLMDKLKAEECTLDQELEDSHGEFDKMKVVFEKKIQLYGRYLNKQEGLTELDRLLLSNKKEWTMSHLLLLIMREETIIKFGELTKRIYRLEKKTAGMPEY
jgi:hypothetical protein